MKVIGIGAGGHAKIILDILHARKNVRVVGLLDANPDKHNKKINGISVLGDDTLLGALYKEGIRHAFVGVGSVGNARLRQDVYQLLIKNRFKLLDIVHPSAVVSKTSRRGNGCMAMAFSVINASAELGDNVLINTGAIIEHDCVIGSHAHIATGAKLAGGVIVGECSHVGIGANVIQGIRIGRNAIVGAGAVVIRDVQDNSTVAGVPAQPIHV